MLSNCGVGGLLRVSWTARRLNQSILKEISTEYSLEGLMLKLALQHFGHLMWRADSLEKPYAGKDRRQEEKGTTENKMVGCITDPIDMGLSKLEELVKDREAQHTAVHGVTKSRIWLSDWTKTRSIFLRKKCIFILRKKHFKILNLTFHLIVICLIIDI